jgi:hypothetical protein
MTSCTAYRYVIFSVFMLLPVQVFTQSDCKLVGSVLDLIIRSTYDMINSASICPHTVNHTESALLPVLLHRSSRVVPGAVHNRRAHAPRVAIRAVPPVVCNQKKKLQFRAQTQRISPSNNYWEFAEKSVNKTGDNRTVTFESEDVIFIIQQHSILLISDLSFKSGIGKVLQSQNFLNNWLRGTKDSSFL